MPFGKEYVYWVTVAYRNLEFLCVRCEINCSGFRTMHTTEIDGQVPIDEHEYVIVTGKLEYLITKIREISRSCQGEVVVVFHPLIAEQLVVNREEVVIFVHEEAGAIRCNRQWQINQSRRVYCRWPQHIVIP